MVCIHKCLIIAFLGYIFLILIILPFNWYVMFIWYYFFPSGFAYYFWIRFPWWWYEIFSLHGCSGNRKREKKKKTDTLIERKNRRRKRNNWRVDKGEEEKWRENLVPELRAEVRGGIWDWRLGTASTYWDFVNFLEGIFFFAGKKYDFYFILKRKEWKNNI